MINYRSLNATLQSSGKGTGIQVSQKIRKWLVISQVAIATILVFVNLGLLKSSLQVINLPISIETEDLTGIDLKLRAGAEISDEEITTMQADLKRMFSDLPEVEIVSQSRPPFGFGFLGQSAQTVEDTQEHLLAEPIVVDEHYFSLINQPLVEGDNYTTADVRDRRLLLIVNDVYADRIAPNGSAIGRKVNVGTGIHTISGVVKGVQMPAADNIPMRAYFMPGTDSRMWFMLKLKPQQSLSRESVVSILKQANTHLELVEMSSMDDQKNQLLFTQYTTAITSAVLAIITFILATIGLYGVLSYTTQMRRFELGTRIAIGAKRFDVIRLIIRDNASAIGIGIAISLIALIGLSVSFNEQLAPYFNPQLIPLFLITMALICLMALFACYWPLRTIINSPVIRSLRGSQ